MHSNEQFPRRAYPNGYPSTSCGCVGSSGTGRFSIQRAIIDPHVAVALLAELGEDLSQ